MASDIVERLRLMGTHYGGSGSSVSDEAAAEIERLRAIVEKARNMDPQLIEGIERNQALDELARLSQELDLP